jgi:hypothetical protein
VPRERERKQYYHLSINFARRGVEVCSNIYYTLLDELNQQLPNDTSMIVCGAIVVEI